VIDPPRRLGVRQLRLEVEGVLAQVVQQAGAPSVGGRVERGGVPRGEVGDGEEVVAEGVWRTLQVGRVGERLGHGETPEEDVIRRDRIRATVDCEVRFQEIQAWQAGENAADCESEMGDDVRVVQLRQDARLRQVTLGVFGTGEAVGARHLDRHGPAQLVVVRQVDPAEAALAEKGRASPGA
jgi:hypothetical protein